MQPGRFGKTTVAVLTVIQEEFDAVLGAFGAECRHPGTNYWYGQRGAEHFVVGKMADRGNGPAAEATRDAIELWRPDIVLLVGIAGALESSDAWLGDVVIPDYLHYGEFRKLTAGVDDLRYSAYDHPTVSLRSSTLEGVGQEGAWQSRVERTRPQGDEIRPGSDRDDVAPRYLVGALVAGEKVMGDPDHPEQEHLFTTFENATAVDMESFGVGRAIHAARSEPGYNPRLGVVRGISDMVHRAPRDGDESKVTRVSVNNDQRRRWKTYAAATAAAFAVTAVEELTDVA
jgi:nucleoside phosphorylase